MPSNSGNIGNIYFWGFLNPSQFLPKKHHSTEGTQFFLSRIIFVLNPSSRSYGRVDHGHFQWDHHQRTKMAVSQRYGPAQKNR